MRPPVPVSTLSDAAKWMSELSGTTMTEREVLGHAFNFQWAAERVQRSGELDEAQAADPRERIVHVLIPAGANLRLRHWRIDGYTDRAATREQHLVALDSYELFDLLTYESAEITMPRFTDPCEGGDHAELILDGTVVALGQLRIHARGLYILAAWWQSTVGAAGARSSQLPEAIPPTLATTTAGNALRKRPAGGDALTALVWSICYDQLDAGQKPTPVPVMTELRERADGPDKRGKYPLLSSVAGGVKWEDSSGNEHELNSAALGERIGIWRTANA